MRRVLEPRLQPRQHRSRVKLLGRAGIAVRERHVGRHAAPTESEMPTICARIGSSVGRLDVERGKLGAFEPQQPGVELLSVSTVS